MIAAGVIMTVPNIAERLTREGVVIEDVTAGKYKRTMTPYKKPTYEDRTKVKEEVENILVLFKSFLKENRPGLDIDKLATGEVWHGSQALKLGLVDEIKTYDDLLLSYVDEHKEVYMLTVKPVMSRFGDDDMPLMQGVMAYVGQWLQSAVAAAVRGALFGSNHTLGEAPAPYMALEDHYAPTLAMDPVYQHPSSSPRM